MRKLSHKFTGKKVNENKIVNLQDFCVNEQQEGSWTVSSPHNHFRNLRLFSTIFFFALWPSGSAEGTSIIKKFGQKASIIYPIVKVLFPPALETLV